MFSSELMVMLVCTLFCCDLRGQGVHLVLRHAHELRPAAIAPDADGAVDAGRQAVLVAARAAEAAQRARPATHRGYLHIQYH